MDSIWNSVLRCEVIDQTDTKLRVFTTLVWDIDLKNKKTILLMNLHSLKGIFQHASNALSDKFRKALNVKKKSKDSDTITFSLYISLSDTEEKKLGQFQLRPEHCLKASEDFDFVLLEIPEIFNGVARLPLCSEQVVCLVLQFLLTIMKRPATRVCIFGFAGAVRNRLAISASICSIDLPCTYYVNSLSAPGMSGSAVVTTRDGRVCGFWCGAFDADKKNTQYLSYAHFITVLPARSPSPPSSPEKSQKTKETSETVSSFQLLSHTNRMKMNPPRRELELLSCVCNKARFEAIWPCFVYSAVRVVAGQDADETLNAISAVLLFALNIF